MVLGGYFFSPSGDREQLKPLKNLNSPGGLQLMHGEPYGASTIVDDFDPVITAFREYLATGNVSTDLLY